MNRLWGSISNDGLSIYDEMFMIICIGWDASNLTKVLYVWNEMQKRNEKNKEIIELCA